MTSLSTAGPMENASRATRYSIGMATRIVSRIQRDYMRSLLRSEQSLERLESLHVSENPDCDAGQHHHADKHHNENEKHFLEGKVRQKVLIETLKSQRLHTPSEPDLDPCVAHFLVVSYRPPTFTLQSTLRTPSLHPIECHRGAGPRPHGVP